MYILFAKWYYLLISFLAILLW